MAFYDQTALMALGLDRWAQGAGYGMRVSIVARWLTCRT